MSDVTGRELGWDDQIEKDAQEFILLPEGDYDFTIEEFERSRSQGKGKLPPCNMAIVHFLVQDGEGRQVPIRENFILHSSLEWKLSELFMSIGQKEKGEKVSMNWNALPGATGRAKVTVDTYTKDGEERKINRISKLYPKPKKAFKAGEF